MGAHLEIANPLLMTSTYIYIYIYTMRWLIYGGIVKQTLGRFLIRIAHLMSILGFSTGFWHQSMCWRVEGWKEQYCGDVKVWTRGFRIMDCFVVPFVNMWEVLYSLCSPSPRYMQLIRLVCTQFVHGFCLSWLTNGWFILTSNLLTILGFIVLIEDWVFVKAQLSKLWYCTLLFHHV